MLYAAEYGHDDDDDEDEDEDDEEEHEERNHTETVRVLLDAGADMTAAESTVSTCVYDVRGVSPHDWHDASAAVVLSIFASPDL